MKLLHAEENIELHYDEISHILYCNWIGSQDAARIKNAGGIILSLVKEKKITKVLNDNARVVGPWHDATEWTREVWFPAMLEAGLLRFAWIVPTNFFPMLSVMRAMPQIPAVKTFPSVDEGRAWLESKLT